MMAVPLLRCPACGEAVEGPLESVATACRCGGCGAPFRLHPAMSGRPLSEAVAAEPRLRTGLTWQAYGGVAAWLAVAAAAIVIALSGWLLPNGQGSTDWDLLSIVLIAVAMLGLFVVGILAVATVGAGCLLCLAVPEETRARNWLGASLAALVLAVLLWIAALVAASIVVSQMTEDSRPSSAAAGLLLVLLATGMVLSLFAAWCHGGFLRRLAISLADHHLAVAAALYQVTLALGLPAVGAITLIFSLFLETSRQDDLLFRLATLGPALLLLTWWLWLLVRLRSSLDAVAREHGC